MTEHGLSDANPRCIRYLKIERISRDAAGRLLDPDGVPYVIMTDDDPEFQPNNPNEKSTGEFHVGSEGTGAGVGVGHCDRSARLWYPRS